jgi:hypothetical protein
MVVLSLVMNMMIHKSVKIVGGARVGVAPTSLRPNESNSTETKVPTTTIIITSNLVPTHPSLSIINTTLDSLKYLQGLPEDTPIMVTVDGRDDGNSSESQRLSEYIQNLKISYPHIQVLASPKRVGLNKNVRPAIDKVQSEFVYVLQHDIAFSQEIDHTGLVEIFQDHAATVRLVRFNLRANLKFRRDRGVCNETELRLYAHGINLTKTHQWSDK